MIPRKHALNVTEAMEPGFIKKYFQSVVKMLDEVVDEVEDWSEEDTRSNVNYKPTQPPQVRGKMQSLSNPRFYGSNLTAR
jgi:hypothetical protein